MKIFDTFKRLVGIGKNLPRQKDIQIPEMQTPKPVLPPKKKAKKALVPSLYYGRRRHKRANDAYRRWKKLQPKSRDWTPVPESKCPVKAMGPIA